MLAGSRFCKNNIEMLFQNEPASFFCKFFKILSHPLSLVTCNREYYKWLCRLRPHIQIGRLPDQGTWLGLVTQFAIWGSMGPTGQTSNNSRINIRWYTCALPSDPSLTCQNSWLETHFVSLVKIIEHAVFELSFLTGLYSLKLSRQYFYGRMERLDSQPTQFMLSTVKSFRLMTDVLVK